MEQPLSVAPPLASPPVCERPRKAFSARRWQLLLLAGWLFQAGLRAWLSHAQTVPLVNPDESAYLIGAQVLAGGPAANFGHSTLYPSGYPLLLVPVFWITHNPTVAYHAVLLINALVSALIMPLGYVGARKLGLSRRLAYLTAMVLALLPAGLMYSEYALADAIFPVLVLAWLLTVHSWMTSESARGRYAAAAGSGLLTGYAYAVHARGIVILGFYLVLCVILILTRLVPRRTIVAAMAGLAPAAGAAWLLNRVLVRDMYPEGPRSMSSEVKDRLQNTHQTLLVFEMALGEMWRLMLDSWGLAAIGLIATLFVMVRPGTSLPTRLMAGLTVLVTAGIDISTPLALPSDQGPVWASGRYLDCMICVFFLIGCVVLLRASRRMLLACALCVVPPTLLLAVIVDWYTGHTHAIPITGFGMAFNFAEPAILTDNWKSANIFLATAVALVLLAVWVAVMTLGIRRRLAVGGLIVGLAAVSLFADVQINDHVAEPYSAAQRADVLGLTSILRPGEPIGVSLSVGYYNWMPQDYEIWWTAPVFFDQTDPPPPGISIVEVPWSPGQAEDATWPTAPQGWQIAASDQSAGWVAWEKS